MAPIRSILVPIDFSSYSEAGLEMAIDIARRFDSRIELLHCYHLYVGSLSPYSETDSEPFNREAREAALRGLHDWRRRVTENGVEIDEHLSEHHPVVAIVEVARDLDVDLIVMGSLGRSGVTRLLLGSIAERIVRLAPCPVMTVRQRRVPAPDPAGPDVC